jgi:hypothetical protein
VPVSARGALRINRGFRLPRPDGWLLALGAAASMLLLYRISTSYLPPLWGWFALQWLRRHEYL